MHSRRSSLYAFVVSRGARAVGVLAAGLAAGVVALRGRRERRREPPAEHGHRPLDRRTDGDLGVDRDDPAGRESRRAAATDLEPVSDEHRVTVNVPAGAYNSVDATFKFTITWARRRERRDPHRRSTRRARWSARATAASNVETVVANNLLGNYTVARMRLRGAEAGRATRASWRSRRARAPSRRCRPRRRRASRSPRRSRPTTSATSRSR